MRATCLKEDAICWEWSIGCDDELVGVTVAQHPPAIPPRSPYPLDKIYYGERKKCNKAMIAGRSGGGSEAGQGIVCLHLA